MAGMVPKRQRDRKWVYTPIGAVLEIVGMEDIGVYITHHQNTVAQYIETRPIMEVCLAEEQKMGLCLSRRWCEQPALDILRIRVGNAEAEGGGRRGQNTCRERERDMESMVGKD